VRFAHLGDTCLGIAQEWPARGQLEFKNVCMRYRDNLPLVLNNLTFDVAPGHKVAIVGRTGAGKVSPVVIVPHCIRVASNSWHRVCRGRSRRLSCHCSGWWMYVAGLSP